jgi:DNA-directed RNA polymerase subunit RPC12/RpoP
MTEGRGYRCDRCGGEFFGRSEAEAEAEYQTVFGDDATAERGVICDDCWKMFLKWLVKNHPELLQGGLLT